MGAEGAYHGGDNAFLGPELAGGQTHGSGDENSVDHNHGVGVGLSGDSNTLLLAIPEGAAGLWDSTNRAGKGLDATIRRGHSANVSTPTHYQSTLVPRRD